VGERWTYEEAEERFRAEENLNCCVTSYVYDEATKRLRLRDVGQVFWR
jgi:hypothetical protein